MHLDAFLGDAQRGVRCARLGAARVGRKRLGGHLRGRGVDRLAQEEPRDLRVVVELHCAVLQRLERTQGLVELDPCVEVLERQLKDARLQAVEQAGDAEVGEVQGAGQRRKAVGTAGKDVAVGEQRVELELRPAGSVCEGFVVPLRLGGGNAHESGLALQCREHHQAGAGAGAHHEALGALETQSCAFAGQGGGDGVRCGEIERALLPRDAQDLALDCSLQQGGHTGRRRQRHQQRDGQYDVFCIGFACQRMAEAFGHQRDDAGREARASLRLRHHRLREAEDCETAIGRNVDRRVGAVARLPEAGRSRGREQVAVHRIDRGGDVGLARGGAGLLQRVQALRLIPPGCRLPSPRARSPRIARRRTCAVLRAWRPRRSRRATACASRLQARATRA